MRDNDDHWVSAGLFTFLWLALASTVLSSFNFNDGGGSKNSLGGLGVLLENVAGARVSAHDDGLLSLSVFEDDELVFHNGVVELSAVDFDFALEGVELEGGCLDALLFAAEAERLHGEGVVGLLVESDLRALAGVLGSSLGDLEPLTGEHVLVDLSEGNW